LKILQIIDQLGLGGAERVCVNLTNLLHSNNYKVKICVLDNIGPLFKFIEKDIEVNILDRKKNKITRYLKLVKFLKLAKESDIIHVHGRNTYDYVSRLLLVHGIKKQLIFHDHSSDYTNVPEFLFNNELQPKYYIGVAEEQLSWLSSLEIKGCCPYLLPNMVVKETVMSKSIKKGAVLIGNIKPNKNQIFAIQLVAKLNTTLTIFGGIQDADYYQLLIQEIDNLNIKDKVYFVHDEVNVQPRLNEFEFGLHTSKAECGPLATVEFLAQSLPFVGFETGEVFRLIKNELPSFYVSTFDVDKWVDQVELVSSNEVDLVNVYKKHFSPTVYLDKCLVIYNNIIL